MKLTTEFWEFLKTAAHELGEPDDAGLGILDDGCTVVTVEYILSPERWSALKAAWEAQEASRSGRYVSRRGRSAHSMEWPISR